MEKVMCECEHVSHFERPHKLSPNGNPTHKYGIHYYDRYMRRVKTPYGTWTVCKDCAADCYQEYPNELYGLSGAGDHRPA